MLIAFALFCATALSSTCAFGNQLVVWGDPTNLPASSGNIVTISAGSGYTLGITSDGNLADWGLDPGVPPPGLSNLAAVAAGCAHSLALDGDGTVAIWGDPGRAWAWGGAPDGLTNVVAVSANGDSDGDNSLVLKVDGSMVAWGNVSSVPTNGPSNIVAIAAGGWHDLALRSDGTIVGWGDDTYGQLDFPAGLSNVVAIAAGDWHSLALTRDGVVFATGVDYKGEVSGANGLSNVVAVSAGAYRSVLVQNDGTMFACGNITGPPPGFTNVIAAATGAGHTVAITVPLQITSVTLSNQLPVIRFHTFFGQEYHVEYSPDLTSGNWSALPGGDIAGNGFDALVIDPQPATASRFYRLKQ